MKYEGLLINKVSNSIKVKQVLDEIEKWNWYQNENKFISLQNYNFFFNIFSIWYSSFFKHFIHFSNLSTKKVFGLLLIQLCTVTSTLTGDEQMLTFQSLSIMGIIRHLRVPIMGVFNKAFDCTIYWLQCSLLGLIWQCCILFSSFSTNP